VRTGRSFGTVRRHTSSRGCALGLIDGYGELLAWYGLCAAGLLSGSPIVLPQFYNSVT